MKKGMAKLAFFVALLISSSIHAKDYAQYKSEYAANYRIVQCTDGTFAIQFKDGQYMDWWANWTACGKSLLSAKAYIEESADSYALEMVLEEARYPQVIRPEVVVK